MHADRLVQALGKLMGAELPPVAGGSGRVLYPASVKAGTDLQDSLASSGFSVTRISTYNTVSPKRTRRCRMGTVQHFVGPVSDPCPSRWQLIIGSLTCVHRYEELQMVKAPAMCVLGSGWDGRLDMAALAAIGSNMIVDSMHARLLAYCALQSGIKSADPSLLEQARSAQVVS